MKKGGHTILGKGESDVGQKGLGRGVNRITKFDPLKKDKFQTRNPGISWGETN